jgi:uncharacterized protein YhaN
MKLDRIILENFGVYARQKFQFDGAPLVLVYGPNESGKTTALNGLRHAMFGFPSRTPYLTGKTMSAEVFGKLADGSVFQFSRKKARKDEVSGKHGPRRLAAEDLPTLFSNMDLDSYQHLFGFSLEELRAGEASLKSAKLTEALAGGGMGGASLLQQLRDELTTAATSLYRSRGSSQIGTLLNEIRERQDELKSLQVLPQAVEELRTKLRQASERGEQAKTQYAALHKQLTRTEKLKQAYPKRQELLRIDQALAAGSVPDGVDATFIAQWSDYAQQQTNLTQAVQHEQTKLAQEQQAIGLLTGANTAPEQSASVEALGHQAADVPKLRSQLIELKRQHDEAELSRARALETLGINQPSDAMLKLSVSVPQRGELEGWAAAYERTCNELLSITAKLESTTDQLSRMDDSNNLDIPDNIGALTELVTKIRDEEQETDELIESVCEKCESAEYEIAGARLKNRLTDCPALDYSWPVPASQDVARFVRNFEEQQRSVAQIEREIQRLEADYASSERELRDLQRDGERSTWGELRQVATERDQLIDNWLDDLSEPLIACSLTPEQQKLRLQQLRLLFQRSDGLLQQIVDTAETLAKITQAQKHLQNIHDNILSLRQQLLQESARREEFARQWLDAWENCPFTPLNPDLMSSWVVEYESWSRVAAALDIERRKLVTRRATIKQLRSELIDQWPTVIEFEAPWQGLLEQLEKWTQVARVSQSENARLVAVQAMHNELQQRQDVLTKERLQLELTYKQWLATHGLPSAWPLAQVTVLVDGVDRLKRDLQTLKRSESQIQEFTARLSAFESKVRELASESEVGAFAPETLAERWLAALQSSRKDAAERARLSASIEHRTARLEEMTARLADIDGRLEGLSASVVDAQGELDRTAFEALMERAQQATQLRIERNEITTSIEMLAGKEPVDSFLSVLAEVDESQLALQVIEVKRSLAQCETERQQADQDVGALTSQLEQLAKSEAAQRGGQRLHALRGQLAELSEQWVVGRLAQELLSRCIDRFAVDNEPVLLQLTHQFLAKLTGGRYASVEYAAGTDGSFCVRNARGEAIEPSKLSTGTREQLYLAIRMAFITHYTEQHEPLPVLMDDCFVNFDDARTRLALQTLLGWKDSVQTILLSGHGRIVQQLADLAPDTPVICLDRHTTHTAREVVGELALIN